MKHYLWAPSCKCWVLGHRPRQDLPSSGTAKKPLRRASFLPGGCRKLPKCVPLPRPRGGGLVESLTRPSSSQSRIMSLFSDPQHPQKAPSRCQNASKMEPKVVPKDTPKRWRNRFRKKRCPHRVRPIICYILRRSANSRKHKF